MKVERVKSGGDTVTPDVDESVKTKKGRVEQLRKGWVGPVVQVSKIDIGLVVRSNREEKIKTRRRNWGLDVV